MFKRTRLNVVAIWFGTAALAVCTGTDIDMAHGQTSGYEWVHVTSNAPWTPRDGAGALVYDDKMWLLGGWNPSILDNDCSNDVWSSTDGADWTLVKPDTFNPGAGDPPFNPATDWEGRHTAGYAVHDNKMWILGGDPLQGHYQTDVWNSTDGATWTHVNAGNPAPWGERVLHHTTTFQGKIWVMGGQTLPPYVASPPEAFYNDVWNSTDGVNWTQVTTSGPMWEPRGMIGNNVVFNDRMWILGGGTYNTPTTPTRNYYNDVWSTADGVSWTKHLNNAPWDPRQYHEVAVYDNKMWVMEGYNGNLGGNRKDVWYSENGTDWTEVPDTPWNPRHAASVYTYDDALWMVAGNNMERDVWKLVPKQANTEPSSAALVVTDTSQVRLYTPDLTNNFASTTPGGTVTGAKFLENGNVVVSTDTGKLQLYRGSDLTPIGSPTTFAEGVTNIVPLSNGNFAVAANSSNAGENYGVWIYNGTTGTTINSNVNWQAPVTQLVETTKGHIAFAVDPAGDGNGSLVLLDGPTGTGMGWTQDWGTVGELTPLANANGDVLFTATNDNNHTPGTSYPNTWGTINGSTGGYKYSNPNWNFVPTVTATENGEIVWNGVDEFGGVDPKSWLYRYTAEGGNLASHLFATEPVVQIVELDNGNIAYSLLYDAGTGLRGEVHISSGDMSAWFGSNTNWDEEPFIAAIPNSNGDLFFQANDAASGLSQAIQFDGTSMANVLASIASGAPDIGEIIALENGNVFFSTSGGGTDLGAVYLLTSGTEESTGPRFLIDSGAIDTPLIAGGKGDNYILHAGGISGGQWFIWAGSGTGAENAPYDIGGFITAGGAPLFIDYFYSESTLVPGDFDGNGVVDVSDLGILATYYGMTEGADLSMGDANGDGAVNVTDLGILATNYGYGTEAVAIPEPSTLPLMCFGVLALLMRRRKR